jgi:exopolysaccharide biosynthesis polyprenyl glycosylphosphotransferase
MPTFERRERVLLQVADAATLSLTAVLGSFALWLVEPTRAGSVSARDIIVTVLALAVSFHLHGMYRKPDSLLRPSRWWRPWMIGRSLPTAVLLALGVQAVIYGERTTLTASAAMALPAIVLVPIGRRVVVRIFGPPAVARILIVGSGQIAERLNARLARCSDIRVVGVADDQTNPSLQPRLGSIASVPELCAQHRIDRVIIAFSETSDSEILNMMRRLNGRVSISIIPRLFELHSWRSDIEELYGLSLVHIPAASLGMKGRVSKRVLDLAIAVVAVVFTLPFWIATAVAIKLDSPGPVFFRQDRAGRGGIIFRIFKFRTMTPDAWGRRGCLAASNEVDGPLFKMQRDPRVTRVGRVLRRTSLDELPQLLNVIVGHMSLVGPRPLPTEESDKLDGAALSRFEVKPGITGLWQVSGRSDLTYADLQHLDSVYVQSWSLLWDLKIILATPRSVLGTNGAY